MTLCVILGAVHNYCDIQDVVQVHEDDEDLLTFSFLPLSSVVFVRPVYKQYYEEIARMGCSKTCFGNRRPRNRENLFRAIFNL